MSKFEISDLAFSEVAIEKEIEVKGGSKRAISRRPLNPKNGNHRLQPHIPKIIVQVISTPNGTARAGISINGGVTIAFSSATFSASLRR